MSQEVWHVHTHTVQIWKSPLKNTQFGIQTQYASIRILWVSIFEMDCLLNVTDVYCSKRWKESDSKSYAAPLATWLLAPIILTTLSEAIFISLVSWKRFPQRLSNTSNKEALALSLTIYKTQHEGKMIRREEGKKKQTRHLFSVYVMTEGMESFQRVRSQKLLLFQQSGWRSLSYNVTEGCYIWLAVIGHSQVTSSSKKISAGSGQTESWSLPLLALSHVHIQIYIHWQPIISLQKIFCLLWHTNITKTQRVII